MKEYIVIALVVVVVIAAHVWLYKWVKFKIDEGVILKFLQQEGIKYFSTQAISSSTKITTGRVSTVCSKSKAIKQNTMEMESWCVSQTYEKDASD
jgi:hypothetical protein